MKMPTEKPRVTFTISQEKLDLVDTYRFDNKFKNQTQAILSLIEKGLSDLEKKETSLFSSEAMQLAKDYDTKLDAWGKRQVRSTADIEIARCAELAQATPEVERLVYVNPAAAGSPLYAESDFERMTFPESDVPPGADFGIRISGHSMEPTVPDGCVAWVHKTVDLDNGSVGIFMLNDSAVCKRYFKNDDGTFRLESDNPDFDPVPVTEFDTVIPVGEVIGTV